MIKRVVKMTFKEEELENFLGIFERTKAQIRHFEGCRHLELWQDSSIPCRLFTFSYWESEEALDEYRHSDLFLQTWAATKVLFAEKPEAWSVKVISHTM